MIWGESNSRDFLDWADFCRNNVIKQKGISSTSGPNFANDKSSASYISVKNTLINLIANNKSISVQQLYNILPTELLVNPTIKNVLLQLYLEDNLKIQGQQKNNDERESNFILVFVKKPAPKVAVKVERRQSNIEELIDNNWQATGRKLDFEKIEREDKSKLNINLKRTNPTPTNKAADKPNIDVRDHLKQKEIPKDIVKAEPKKEIPEPKNSNITYIQIPKAEPKIEKEEVAPAVKVNLEYRPMPKKKEVIIEDNVFNGLSAFDLYYLESFLSDAAIKEKDKQHEIKITRDILKVRGNIKYSQEKQTSTIKVIFSFIGCLTIIGIPIVIASNSNKIRKKARKIYKENLKNRSYENLKSDLKTQNPRIIEF
ncbi:hypothetical protein [Spiroplasma cantharicola]|uniref:Uncharacterized protein n=1 Tax=Spiroplasma cantharicola TaxID=362837 RepID=A0A0M4KFG1_9MOLU|nr:hypothetical protein [Spiroplasma cantharicola]ALD66870.1 hypothetical protein SCANT_v1c09640 [Spiroplasma cantharicola]